MRGNKTFHSILFVHIIIFLLLSTFSIPSNSINSTFNDSINKIDDKGDKIQSIPSEIEDNWPMFRYNLAHWGSSQADAPESSVIKWQKSLGKMESSPAIYDGKLYITSCHSNQQSSLLCIDIAYGDIIWETFVQGQIISSPAISDGYIYFGSDDRNVYCFNTETGDFVWKFETLKEIYSSPSVYKDSVLIGSNDGYLYRIDALDGTLIWKYQTDGAIKSSTAVVNDIVYFSSLDGYLYAIDFSTSTLKWQPYKIHESNLNSQITSSPLIYDNNLYIGSLDHQIYCINALHGTFIWSYPTGNKIYSSPSIFNDNLYVASSDRKIYCFDIDSESLLWKNTTDSDVIYASTAIADGKVFISTWGGMLYCYDCVNGSKLWQFDTNHQCFSSPVVSYGKVFLGSFVRNEYEGMLYCIGETNQAPHALFSIEPIEATTYETIFLNDSSYDTDGHVVKWSWYFGDGTTSQVPNPRHEYEDDGVYTIRLDVEDNEEAVNSTQKQVTIVNQPPMVQNDTVVILVNTSRSIYVLNNDDDVDGKINKSSLTITTYPFHGIAIVNTVSFAVDYDPYIGYVGNDSFSYSIQDDDGVQSTGFVHIIVTEDTNPVAQDDSYNTNEDTELIIQEPGVLGNDYDPDDSQDNLTAVLDASSIHGTIQLHQNGSFTYHPDANYYGLDNFSYFAFDGQYISNITTVYLTILSQNDAPIAVNDSVSTMKNIAVDLFVLENDIDIENDINISSLTIVDTPEHGSLTIDYSTGKITYNPESNYAGADEFAYKIYDYGGTVSNIGFVSISIAGNQKPNAKFSYYPSNPAVNQTIRFKDESNDPDGQIVQWSWDFGDGSISSSKNPEYIYDDIGYYTVQLTVKDNEGLFDSKTLMISVHEASLNPPRPQITIIEPTSQSIVHGIILINGEATPANGDIIKVEIRFNNEAWQVADGTTEWEYLWDTILIEDGLYTISARCLDEETVSYISTITVNVSNNPPDFDDSKPTVQFLFPTDGDSVQGIITIKGRSLDDYAVEFVELSIQNGNWIQVNGTAVWSYQFDTTTYTDGTYQIAARCYDGTQFSDTVSLDIHITNNQLTPQNEQKENTSDETFTSAMIFIIIIIFTILFGIGVIGYVVKMKI